MKLSVLADATIAMLACIGVGLACVAAIDATAYGKFLFSLLAR